MFDVTFANNATVRMDDDATLHDLSRLVIQHGKIMHMQRVRQPQAFTVDRVAFDVVN